MDRKNYKYKLTEFLGFEYEKNEKTSKKLFSILFPKINIAIKNASEGYSKIGNHQNPALEESSTTVFKLVEKILKFM